jgi:hypothetical protein
VYQGSKSHALLQNKWQHYWSDIAQFIAFLGAFAKLQKATISFMSVHMEQLDSH